MRAIARATACAVVAAVILWGAPSGAAGQEVSAAALKAAFLANFAKFAEWPDDVLAQGQTFGFCVIGDRAVAEALQQTVKSYSGGTFRVTMLKPEGPFQGCHLLYVAGTDTRQAVQTIEAVRGEAVFIAGEADHFAEAGGVAQLVQDHGRMRFAINTAAAQRAHLVLSAKLLNLAILVKDTTDASR